MSDIGLNVGDGVNPVASLTQLRKQVDVLGSKLAGTEECFVSAEPELLSVKPGYQAECDRLARELKDLVISKNPANLHVFTRSFDPAGMVRVDFERECFSVKHNGVEYTDLPLSRLPAYWTTDGFRTRSPG